MSRSVASSRDIQRLSALEDRLAANPVRASLEPAAAHEVHLTAHNVGDLFQHRHAIEKAPVRIRAEGDENVDIAIRAEILAQGGAEQGQLGHLPPATKLLQPSLLELNARI